jgi:Ser/Thr protein kinase RdoA (MazF antagonist)
VPTSSGAIIEMVEWPDGKHHPLALLTFVRGDPLEEDDDDAAELLGDVCGRVHAALLDVAPADVGVTVAPDAPVHRADVDVGPEGWLNDVCFDLDERTTKIKGELRHSISVWDGPDIRRTATSTGVLDFGICGWHPLVHVVANRSLSAALADESRLDPFLVAVERHLPLTATEHDLIPLFRQLNAAIYARWVAAERILRHDPTFNDGWFTRLVSLVEREALDSGSPADG